MKQTIYLLVKLFFAISLVINIFSVADAAPKGFGKSRSASPPNKPPKPPKPGELTKKFNDVAKKPEPPKPGELTKKFNDVAKKPEPIKPPEKPPISGLHNGPKPPNFKNPGF